MPRPALFAGLCTAADRGRYGRRAQGQRCRAGTLERQDALGFLWWVDRQNDEKRAARQFFGIVARAFNPDAPAVALDYAARNRQAKPGSRAHKLRRAGRMEAWVGHAEELLEDQFLVLRVDADARILDGNQDLVGATMRVSLQMRGDVDPATIWRVCD